MSRKRSKPFFSEETVKSIVANFIRSMDESEKLYDDNLIDAVRSYAVSSKSEEENLLLRHVANGAYRLLYDRGSAAFGVRTPEVLAEYKKKYPMEMSELRKNPDLYRQAMLDSVEMDLKRHLEEYKTRQANLSASLANVGRYAAKDAGKIDSFLKQPFIEQSTKVEAPAEASSPANSTPPLVAAAASAISGSLSVS